LDWRKRIIQDFAIVFKGTDTGNSEAIADEDFASKWGWFGVMHRLCNQDISKLSTITKLHLLEALTWLSYETDLDLTKKVRYDKKQNI
tara:strand:+ start:70 stop:333 length:264 start_codon:yes stop_codon:yes gene_type:complete